MSSDKEIKDHKENIKKHLIKYIQYGGLGDILTKSELSEKKEMIKENFGDNPLINKMLEWKNEVAVDDAIMLLLIWSKNMNNIFYKEHDSGVKEFGFFDVEPMTPNILDDYEEGKKKDTFMKFNIFVSNFSDKSVIQKNMENILLDLNESTFPNKSFFRLVVPVDYLIKNLSKDEMEHLSMVNGIFNKDGDFVFDKIETLINAFNEINMEFYHDDKKNTSPQPPLTDAIVFKTNEYGYTEIEFFSHDIIMLFSFVTIFKQFFLNPKIMNELFLTIDENKKIKNIKDITNVIYLASIKSFSDIAFHFDPETNFEDTILAKQLIQNDKKNFMENGSEEDAKGLLHSLDLMFQVLYHDLIVETTDGLLGKINDQKMNE